ncbi:hypothetical protein GMORB2_7322 [Geosmithia morbida]|uniref:Hypersensitive response-inducing protein n=1 Tax=Geosmithia morbida TaxID=1094350 RepID=A0A9P5D407_9HYPO|nr:uncharacterized protein GMORB2_7322 [Geosmithia morbida]KAF4122330.1 hypothetical protein GMORB2_7322 [Geosmithia morbida]
MKFSIVAVLSAAAAVSALPVFEVSDFSASCIPHSSQCSYAFNVIRPGNGEVTPIKCSSLTTSDGTLPAVKEGTCKDSSRTFSVTRILAGLHLTVSQPVTPSSNLTGSYTIPQSQLVTSTEPNAEVQSYNGPTSFRLD